MRATSLFAIFLASLCPTATGNDCHLAFHTAKGLHTVPLKGGEARRIGSSNIKDVAPHSSMGVDGVRGIAVWSEDNRVYSLKLNQQDATPKLLITVTRQGRGTQQDAKHIHGLALQTETETVFVSAHESVGGYRVVSFKYTDPQPTLNWAWCGALNCGILSRYPSGGGLSTANGKLFVSASRATKTRDLVNGGCALGYWTTGSKDTLKMNSQVEALNSEKYHRFPGIIANVHVDELSDKIYVSESSSDLYSRIWETTVDAAYFKVFIETLPPFQVMNLDDPYYGVPSCNHAYLGAEQFAVSNTSHIFVATGDSVQKDQKDNIIYALPADEVSEESFMAPMVKYCDGEHVGGKPKVDGNINDEL